VEVVVKLKDYDWREVYKNDILTIIGIGVVVILVVVVSVFSNMSRVAFDTTEREEKKSVETTVIQSVSTLEQSIVGIAERVDSLDAHFMEETTMLKKMIKPTVNAKHGERKKK
jgi:Na+-transporting methylmalonyl-CoA/oxaloacetate decarboxylase gamma subunit